MVQDDFKYHPSLTLPWVALSHPRMSLSPMEDQLIMSCDGGRPGSMTFRISFRTWSGQEQVCVYRTTPPTHGLWMRDSASPTWPEEGAAQAMPLASVHKAYLSMGSYNHLLKYLIPPQSDSFFCSTAQECNNMICCKTITGSWFSILSFWNPRFFPSSYWVT